MPEIEIRGSEWYPVWTPVRIEHSDGDLNRHRYEVSEEQLLRWEFAEAAFNKAQREMRDIVDPPCPDCGHQTSRHQAPITPYGYAGCLARIEVTDPEDRLFPSRRCICTLTSKELRKMEEK